MANALQQAGATSEPSNFAPLHTNRIFTGLWTNRSPLRDAATSDYQEHYGMGRQDSIIAGFNSEISPRITLWKRPGSSVFNTNAIPPVKRFYSFNTFTLTDESIRVMADTRNDVRDVTVEANGTSTNRVIWTKNPAVADGLHSTYFLGVGNTLYFTDGMLDLQVTYDPATNTWGTVTAWGVDSPDTPPSVSLPQFTTYGTWQPNTVFSRTNRFAPVLITDSNNNIQNATQPGVTGIGNPIWETTYLHVTVDGSVSWQNMGNGQWVASANRAIYDLVHQLAADGNAYYYQAQINGAQSAATPANWLAGVGSITQDGAQQWLNLGLAMTRAQIGDQTNVVGTSTILDPNGGVQACMQSGKSGTTIPNFNSVRNAYTPDPVGNATGSILWQNAGAVAPVMYGYAYMDSKTKDISNMSPASIAISTSDGEAVHLQGIASGDNQVDTVVIFRTAHGGSTFLYDTQIPNPAGGVWTYDDTTLDANLNTEWQAQVNGEGTPLPDGATCLGYHLGRIFAAVGNVVYISSGPDAVAGGSSGNAGFDTTFTAQSKITRFWTCSLGMVVFTVRDAYIILGSGTDADPLYMVVFIEDIPLRSYDCFSVNKTTPYLLQGNNTLVSLDPSAGIIEAGFPIADRLEEEFNSAASYVTFHKQSSRDTALYAANGVDRWYRMSATNAPESGSAWSPRAQFTSLGCVQSVEVTPGQYRLLMSGTAPGPILQRDASTRTDNGVPFTAATIFGSIVLALPGQLAALSFITLESVRIGTRPTLALLLGETHGTFETLKRTRQDPTNLPPSNTLFSDRYHFAQNQKTAWCRHFQMVIEWPAEDAANELLTFTIFGQTWQEMRSQ